MPQLDFGSFWLQFTNLIFYLIINFLFIYLFIPYFMESLFFRKFILLVSSIQKKFIIIILLLLLFFTNLFVLNSFKAYIDFQYNKFFKLMR